MARKDLAGLAALGALGMMMSSKGKEKYPDSSPMDAMTGSAVSANPNQAGSSPDLGEIRSEDGSLSSLRRNTETNDLYSPNAPITRPSASSMATVNNAIKNQKPMSSGRENARDDILMRQGKTAGGRENARDDILMRKSGADKDSAAGTYRSLSGEVKPKSADNGAEERAAKRAALMDSMSGAASSVGDYLSSMGDREEKHGTYRKDGKVVRYAKGGLTKSFKPKVASSRTSASSRGDGIATKGHTRGRVL